MNNIPEQERIVVNPTVLYFNDLADTRNTGSFLEFHPYGYQLIVLVSAHCVLEMIEACFTHKVITPERLEDWLTSYLHNRWRKNA